MQLRHLPVAFVLVCSIALAQSFTPIREQKNLSPAAIAKLHTLEMFNSLPVGEWRFHAQTGRQGTAQSCKQGSQSEEERRTEGA